MANFEIMDAGWEDQVQNLDLEFDGALQGFGNLPAPGWGFGYAPGWGLGAAPAPLLVTPTVPVVPSFLQTVKTQAEAVWANPAGKVAIVGLGAYLAWMGYEKYLKQPAYR
ncbi:MAG: hypothetical protein WC718_12840 [Phycisphaerales bacterium]|jgi:hypothetical protein